MIAKLVFSRQILAVWTALALHQLTLGAAPLDQQLLSESAQSLAKDARTHGDAERGAALFYRVSLGCASCHTSVGQPGTSSLGPNLAKLKGLSHVSDEDLIQSILNPSARIRDDFKTRTLELSDGRVVTGIEVESQDADQVTLRDASTRQIVTFPLDDIETSISSSQSLMPDGVINALQQRSEFLDLLRYLYEIRDGGPSRAAELEVPAALASWQIPEYESHIDHAQLIRGWNSESYERGGAIYRRVCQNCHGTLEQPGSLPTALRFGEGKFRNGKDPYSLYQTLTHGFGLMVPQTWMVPQQKYDVIHYVRETFLRSNNPNQYFSISQTYLDALPAGDTLGPEPVDLAPWSDMDYGPWMFNTIEVSDDGSNIAYKGIAVRVDEGPGGVSRGQQWMLFDHDTMRLAAAWQHSADSPTRFIDWQGIHFDGRHQAHPHVAGRVIAVNPNGPGWANPTTGRFDDTERVVGRDNKRYGPLPKSWAEYRGLFQVGTQPIVSYRIGSMEVLEQFGARIVPWSTNHPASEATNSQSPAATAVAFYRTLDLSPSAERQILSIATDSLGLNQVQFIDDNAVIFASTASSSTDNSASSAPTALDGQFDESGWLQIRDMNRFDTATKDFSWTARIRTKQDGVILSRTKPGDRWVPNGQVLFLRGGRLCYDIGWVGVVTSERKINDNQWHDVAIVWTKDDQMATLFVDGKKVGRQPLAPEAPLDDSVFRIGYGAPNFPAKSSFQGEIQRVRFYQRALTEKQLVDPSRTEVTPDAAWLDKAVASTNGADAEFVSDAKPSSIHQQQLVVGLTGDSEGCQFRQVDHRLCLVIEPSDRARQFSVWMIDLANTEVGDTAPAAVTAQFESARSQLAAIHPARSLTSQIKRPAFDLWPEKLVTQVDRGPWNEAGFAIDVLSAPSPNPWLARLRLSGHDFYADGNRMAVCTWDGDVYEVAGLSELDSAHAPSLTWKRIASGLFQPLGLKIVDGQIYLTCRDQLVILRDRDQDQVVDYYECFNNDQQVTEHFHEFAMGLQRDDQGNFYYAKSARHALPALVPHHGTLLRVSPDGKETEILAVGFRAANGVCLNPDGSFVVTDQEGHWNPKNRINWVTPGGFYGNMYGYHDITDESDAAMSQPLCWITNAFDRSPAELLWVPDRMWGNLSNVLLNLSYGYGKVYTVPHEHLDSAGGVQGAMCAFPIPSFPTGTMRGRFHSQDGQLYVCGLFAWGSQQQAKEGGLFRIRYRGEGAIMPVGIQATQGHLSVTFSDPVSPATVNSLDRFHLKVWGLKRTKNYGSPHVDEHELVISEAALSNDNHTLTFTVPNLDPTWCYELRCELTTADGQSTERVLHGTIHTLNPAVAEE